MHYLVFGEDSGSLLGWITSQKKMFLKERPKGEVVTFAATDFKDLKDLGVMHSGGAMFADSFLVVLRNVFSEGSVLFQQQLEVWLAKEKEGKDTSVTLILWEDKKPDQRLTSVKSLQKLLYLKEFPALTNLGIRDTIKSFCNVHKFTLDKSINLEDLSNSLANTPGINLHLELEKIELAMMATQKTVIGQEEIDLMPIDATQEVWELFNLALTEKSKALALLEKQWQQGKKTEELIGFLAFQLRQMLLAEYFPNLITDFQKRKLGRARNLVNNQKLQLALAKLLDLDIANKSKALDDRLALVSYIAWL